MGSTFSKKKKSKAALNGPKVLTAVSEGEEVPWSSYHDEEVDDSSKSSATFNSLDLSRMSENQQQIQSALLASYAESKNSQEEKEDESAGTTSRPLTSHQQQAVLPSETTFLEMEITQGEDEPPGNSYQEEKQEEEEKEDIGPCDETNPVSLIKEIVGQQNDDINLINISLLFYTKKLTK